MTKNVTDACDYVAKTVTDATRSTITGRQDIRVRDFVQMPRVVRRMDKYSFTLGVLGISETQYVDRGLPLRTVLAGRSDLVFIKSGC